MSMLKVEDLHVYYGSIHAIKGISFEVNEGEVVTLIGANGAGKSTTLNTVSGLLKPRSGSVTFEDKSIVGVPAHKIVSHGMALCPEGRRVFLQMTVQENIELGLQPLGGKGKIPDYIFDLFPILPKFAKRKGGDLSGGQQQQLAIARALVAEPKILILDEPTEGIQPSIIQNIGAAIKKINEWKGISILLVEQYLDFVMEHTDSLYVMEKGSIIYQNTTSDADKTEVQKLMTD